MPWVPIALQEKKVSYSKHCAIIRCWTNSAKQYKKIDHSLASLTCGIEHVQCMYSEEMVTGQQR